MGKECIFLYQWIMLHLRELDFGEDKNLLALSNGSILMLDLIAN
jgi:hypothetical protein